MELYLDQCINSICSQTYCDLQIILVNDGSTDNSEKILEKWAEKDPRIEVIKKENGGLVSARKAGIECARGDYSVYVDGDDWIENDYIEKMVNSADSDIICAGHIVEFENDRIRVKNNIACGKYATDTIIPDMLYYHNFYKFGITQYVWSKMFKTHILKEAQLEIPDEITIGEDVAVTYNSILKSQSVNIIDYEGYHYVQRNNSMCNIFQSNEAEKCKFLLEYLFHSYDKDFRRELLMQQLNQYAKLLYLSRAIEVFDEKQGEKILTPFGGIEKKCKVVLYGAGAIGKRIRGYLGNQSAVNILAWVDKNYKRYEYCDERVCSPDEIDFSDGRIDYIIICISDSSTINLVRGDLLKKTKEEKIIFLTNSFMYE